MKEINLILFIAYLCWGHIGNSTCFAQDKFIYKGELKDSITHTPLTDVRIFIDNDTIGISNEKDGNFQLNIKEGTIIRFRKRGYRWLNLKVDKQSPVNLEMVQSSISEMHNFVDELIIDGKKIPKEEWNDINSEYFSEVSVNVENNKTIITIRLSPY